MWEYMVLALKVTIGGILWILAFTVICFIVGALGNIKSKPKKKPKWDGQPIVHQGGKKDEES